MAEAVGIAAGAVAAEQVVMTGVEAGAVVAIARPSQPLRGSLSQIAKPSGEDASPALARSLHTATCIGTKVYIFGGEHAPAKPCSADVHAVSLSAPAGGQEQAAAEYACYPPVALTLSDSTPVPRRSHAACGRGKYLVVHGGELAEPAEEPSTSLWLWDSDKLGWDMMRGQEIVSRPAPGEASPAPPTKRFGHSIFLDEERDLLVLHGGRTSDSDPDGPASRETWIFNFDSLSWVQLAPAPAATLACAFVPGQATLYTISGTSDLGHTVHLLRLPKGEDHLELSMAEWQSVEIPTSPLVPGPRLRVGGALLPIETGMGRHYLVYLLGSRAHTVGASPTSAESEQQQQQQQQQPPPQTLAAVAFTTEHPFYSDVWALQLPAVGFTGARIKDALRDALPGVESGRWSWAEVDVAPMPGDLAEVAAGAGKAHPGPRGFFGADVLGGRRRGEVIFWGGENAAGAREGDGWILKVW